MAFQIQGGNDLGTILAGLRPMRDPTEVQEGLVRLRQVQQQQAQQQQLFPLQKQEAELALKSRQFEEQERQLSLKERGIIQNSWIDALGKAKPDQTQDEIYQTLVRPKLFAGGVRPDTISKSDTIQSTFGATIAETRKRHADATKAIADAAKTNQEVSDKAREDIGDYGVHLRDDTKYDQGAFESLISRLKAEYATMPKIVDRLDGISTRAAESPEALKREIDNMITQGAEGRAAKRAQEKAQATEAGQKVDAAEYQATLRDIQGAPVDVNGVPTPEAWAQIRSKHPKVTLSEVPSKESIDRLVRAGVPAEKQPEWDLNSAKARMGVLGNDKFDQFLSQYARSVGKTPATLAPREFFDGMQKYAELTQDPTMRGLAITQKQLADTMTRLQMSQMPTEENYQTLAKSLIDGSLSPTQFNELKAGRMGQVSPSKVFLLAKQIDPKFSLSDAEQRFKTWEKTENDFATGKQGDMVRAVNNALEHTGLLEQARVAMANNDVPMMARIANYFGTAAGGDLRTTFDLIARKVGDEWEKAFVPGGGGQAERMMSAADFSSGLGDTQLKSNIRAAIHLGDSQIRNLQAQYKRGTYGRGTQELFTPEAAEVRRRILGETGPAPGAAGPLPRPSSAGQAADEATIKAYVQANGNDKAKARKALTDAGWTIPPAK